MDYHMFIVSNQKEESISIQRVNRKTCYMYIPAWIAPASKTLNPQNARSVLFENVYVYAEQT